MSLIHRLGSRCTASETVMVSGPRRTALLSACVSSHFSACRSVGSFMYSLPGCTCTTDTPYSPAFAYSNRTSMVHKTSPWRQSRSQMCHQVSCRLLQDAYCHQAAQHPHQRCHTCERAQYGLIVWLMSGCSVGTGQSSSVLTGMSGNIPGPLNDKTRSFKLCN